MCGPKTTWKMQDNGETISVSKYKDCGDSTCVDSINYVKPQEAQMQVDGDEDKEEEEEDEEEDGQEADAEMAPST